MHILFDEIQGILWNSNTFAIYFHHLTNGKLRVNIGCSIFDYGDYLVCFAQINIIRMEHGNSFSSEEG